MVYIILCLFLLTLMSVLTSGSTDFEIWYDQLLDMILRRIQAGLDYVLPINQAQSRYGKLFNPNIFEQDVESICCNNNLRVCCVCRNKNIYIVPF
jgi:hypothetical protein